MTDSPLYTHVWRDDVPVSIIVHGTTETALYLETDHLTIPIAARDQAGKVVWTWESDAFGSTLPNEDPDGDGTTVTINLRFPGQYFDKESGLHYNYRRYYDPKLGRYMSPDPIGLAGGNNLYGYVGGNPLGSVDPEGLAPPGHHFVPRQIARNYQFSPEAKAVFEKSTTGPVEHYFDKGHRAYNKEVGDLVDKFLEENKIDPTKMTAEEAQQCVDAVKRSKRPPIETFLKFLKGGGGVFRAPLLLCPACGVLRDSYTPSEDNGA